MSLADEPVRPKPHFIRVDHLEESAVKGLYSHDITQYLKITKLTIQKYLEACIHKEGQFREFFDRFATFSVGYVVNENLSDDPSDRHLQIARYFSGAREAPPQIFIRDGGYTYTPASLGSLTDGWNTQSVDGTQVVRVMDVVPIPIEITCASTKEQEVDDLIALMSAAFGQFQRFTSNYILHPPREYKAGQRIYWEVRIPLQHSIAPKSHSSLHNDPKDQLWQATCNMEVEFENSTYMKYRAGPRYSPKNSHFLIDIPDKVPLTKQTMFALRDMPYPVNVYSDDSRIAVVRRTATRFVIKPKKLGTFKLLITTGVAKKGTKDNMVIAEKEITIIIR